MKSPQSRRTRQQANESPDNVHNQHHSLVILSVNYEFDGNGSRQTKSAGSNTSKTNEMLHTINFKLNKHLFSLKKE